MENFKQEKRKRQRAFWGLAFLAVALSVSLGAGQLLATEGMGLESIETMPAEWTDGFFKDLTGAFMPLVSMSGSPFLTLAILSSLGYFLKIGWIPADFFGNAISDSLIHLPIANLFVMILLLVLTALRILLGMIAGTKILSDALLGKIEKFVGTLSIVVFVFLRVLATLEKGSTSTNGIVLQTQNTGGYLMAVLLSVLISALAYLMYLVMRTTVSALDGLSLILAPIPGATAFFTIVKNAISLCYIGLAIVSPKVALAIGLFFLVIAVLVFRIARRMEKYYRSIYLTPLLRKIFNRPCRVGLMPEKLPSHARKEFSHIKLFLPVFVVNKNKELKLKKREKYTLVWADGKGWLYRRFLLKKRKIEIEGSIYIEKCFRFIRIFTQEELPLSQRRFSLLTSVEYAEWIPQILEETGMMDYQVIKEEIKRRKEEQRAEQSRSWTSKFWAW